MTEESGYAFDPKKDLVTVSSVYHPTEVDKHGQPVVMSKIQCFVFSYKAARQRLQGYTLDESWEGAD